MIKTIAVNFLLIAFLFCGYSFSQEKEDKLQLLFAFDEPDCETIIHQLDSLMLYLSENSDSYGYVIVYGGENPVRNIIYEQAVKGRFLLHKFDQNRYSVKTAKSGGQLKVEIWVGKNGEKPKLEEDKFSFNLGENTKPIIFGEDTLQSSQENGKLSFFGWNCEICCLNYLDLNLLSKFLEANPQIAARLTFYNKSKRQADKIAKIVLEEATKDYKIPRNRLKINYGGKNKLSNPELKELVDVEVLLVSQK